MEGQYRTASAMALPQLRLERLIQASSGPFRRTHCLDQPSLVYLPSPGSDPALGCFGDPHSHRDFLPFGIAVLVPAHVPLHVVSPGCAEREMVIARFGGTTGAGPDPAAFAACADVRAPAVIDLMRRLTTEMARPAVARETMLAGLGLLILAELARHFEQLRDGAEGRRGMLAAWQIRRIEARLAEPNRPMPDIDELAGLCGIGRRHLMRAYKATTGTTVMDRVERGLFDRACAMLVEERRPVKAVAAALGYRSQGSFTTAFRRRVGETPSGWRMRRISERTLQR